MGGRASESIESFANDLWTLLGCHRCQQLKAWLGRNQLPLSGCSMLRRDSGRLGPLAGPLARGIDAVPDLEDPGPLA